MYSIVTDENMCRSRQSVRDVRCALSRSGRGRMNMFEVLLELNKKIITIVSD